MFGKQIPNTRRNRAWMKEMLLMAEDYLTKPCECLPYSLFELYEKQGTRLEYENACLEHRKRLSSFFFSYLWTNDQKWFMPLIDAIWATLDEFTWAFPAHVITVKTKDIPSCVDLFNAETCASVSWIYGILKDELPLMVKERIEIEINRRIVEPFFAGKVGFPKNNWSAVECVGISAALSHVFPDRFEEGLPAILNGLERFLSSYEADGCCMEGVTYWMYGFGFFCYAANLICDFTKGKVDLFADEKVRTIASFRQKAAFGKGYVVPFADCPICCRTKSGLSRFLCDKYPEVYFPSDDDIVAFLEDGRFRFMDILHDLFWDRDEPSVHKNENPYYEKGEYYFADAQWFIKRDSVSFAVKGGHNDEPHNHNDVGSFSVFDGEKFVFGDIGWAEYDKNYFHGDRYANICASSFGHSVPIVNGQGQRLLGVEAKSTVEEVGKDTITFDIGKVYGVNAFKRRFTFHKTALTVTDECEEPYIERLTCLQKPTVSGTGIECSGFTAYVDIPCKIEITEKTYQPRRILCSFAYKEWETVYLVDFIPTEKQNKITLTIEKK